MLAQSGAPHTSHDSFTFDAVKAVYIGLNLPKQSSVASSTVLTSHFTKLQSNDYLGKHNFITVYFASSVNVWY